MTVVADAARADGSLFATRFAFEVEAARAFAPDGQATEAQSGRGLG
jgi:hypothetical protein